MTDTPYNPAGFHPSWKQGPQYYDTPWSGEYTHIRQIQNIRQIRQGRVFQSSPITTELVIYSIDSEGRPSPLWQCNPASDIYRYVNNEVEKRSTNFRNGIRLNSEILHDQVGLPFTFDEDKVYVNCNEGLICYNADSGSIVWAKSASQIASELKNAGFSTGNVVGHPIRVFNNKLVVNLIYLFDKQDGSFLKKLVPEYYVFDPFGGGNVTLRYHLRRIATSMHVPFTYPTMGDVPRTLFVQEIDADLYSLNISAGLDYMLAFNQYDITNINFITASDYLGGYDGGKVTLLDSALLQEGIFCPIQNIPDYSYRPEMITLPNGSKAYPPGTGWENENAVFRIEPHSSIRTVEPRGAWDGWYPGLLSILRSDPSFNFVEHDSVQRVGHSWPWCYPFTTRIYRPASGFRRDCVEFSVYDHILNRYIYYPGFTSSSVNGDYSGVSVKYRRLFHIDYDLELFTVGRIVYAKDIAGLNCPYEYTLPSNNLQDGPNLSVDDLLKQPFSLCDSYLTGPSPSDGWFFTNHIDELDNAESIKYRASLTPLQPGVLLNGKMYAIGVQIEALSAADRPVPATGFYKDARFIRSGGIESRYRPTELLTSYALWEDMGWYGYSAVANAKHTFVLIEFSTDGDVANVMPIRAPYGELVGLPTDLAANKSIFRTNFRRATAAFSAYSDPNNGSDLYLVTVSQYVDNMPVRNFFRGSPLDFGLISTGERLLVRFLHLNGEPSISENGFPFHELKLNGELGHPFYPYTIMDDNKGFSNTYTVLGVREKNGILYTSIGGHRVKESPVFSESTTPFTAFKLDASKPKGIERVCWFNTCSHFPEWRSSNISSPTFNNPTISEPEISEDGRYMAIFARFPSGTYISRRTAPLPAQPTSRVLRPTPFLLGTKDYEELEGKPKT